MAVSTLPPNEFQVARLRYLPNLLAPEEGAVTVGVVLLRACQPIDFISRELLPCDCEDEWDCRMVNEILREVDEDAATGALAEVYQRFFENASNTLCLDTPTPIRAANLEDAVKQMRSALSEEARSTPG